MGPLATPGATAQQLLPMEAPAARRLLKAASVETVELAGIRTLKILVMVNTRKKFPRGISDQVISLKSFDGNNLERAPGPGLKKSIWFFQDHQWKQRHDPSFKPQAPSVKHHAPVFRKLQALSLKHQASSAKRQASQPE